MLVAVAIFVVVVTYFTSTFLNKGGTYRSAMIINCKVSPILVLATLIFSSLPCSVYSFAPPQKSVNIVSNHLLMNSSQYRSGRRRSLIVGAGMFSGFFGEDESKATNGPPSTGKKYQSKGPTNEVVKVVNGIKHRRLGGSDIIVSELGLGTQRW